MREERSLSIEKEGFSAAEEQMIAEAVAALESVGYDVGIIKLLARASLPTGHGGMTLFAFSGAALGPEAFRSQEMLNYVLEEELLHLVQMTDPGNQVFSRGTAQDLEDAVHATRKFHPPS